MKNNLIRRIALLSLLVLAGCTSQKNSQLPVASPESVQSHISRLLPAGISDRAGWSHDMFVAFNAQSIPPQTQNICAAIAVAEQESNFNADAPVPGLGKIAWKEIDRRAAALHLPAFVVHTALLIKSPDGRSYSERLDKVRSEKELSAVFDDFIDMVPLGQKLFGNLNPIHTGGPMQVSIEFAEAHARGYPWPVDKTIRREVFTRHGGMYFGIMHLLGYPADYSQPLYRFADYNAGWYASRNAAFQSAVNRLTGMKLALDGDLILYGSEQAGATEKAVRLLAKRLDISDGDIRDDLEKGQEAAFSNSDLYKGVFRLADRQAGRPVARELLPGIKLESPKITRNLTTAWFAQRVDQRYQRCLKRD